MSVASSELSSSYTTTTSGYLSQQTQEDKTSSTNLSIPTLTISHLKPKRRWIDMSNTDTVPSNTQSSIKDTQDQPSPPKRLKGYHSTHDLTAALPSRTIHRPGSLPCSSPLLLANTDSSASSSSSLVQSPYSIGGSLAGPSLPISHDPRLWNKLEVRLWLEYMRITHKLQIDLTRFDMNGKALCLMTMEMFTNRVPTGGKLLYKDFKLRLHRAVFIEDFQQQRLQELSALYKMQQAFFLQSLMRR